MSVAAMISLLWDKAYDSALTDDELEKLGRAEQLRIDLQNVASIMSGVAALVSQQDPRLGYFREGADVAELLWGLSSTIQASAEAVLVSVEANALLIDRERAKSASISSQGSEGLSNAKN